MHRRPNKFLWTLICLLIASQGYLFFKLNKLNKFLDDQGQDPMMQPPNSINLQDSSVPEMAANMKTMYTLIGNMMHIMSQVQELNENPELRARMKEAAEVYQSLKNKQNNQAIDEAIKKRPESKPLTDQIPLKLTQKPKPFLQKKPPVVQEDISEMIEKQIKLKGTAKPVVNEVPKSEPTTEKKPD